MLKISIMCDPAIKSSITTSRDPPPLWLLLDWWGAKWVQTPSTASPPPPALCSSICSKQKNTAWIAAHANQTWSVLTRSAGFTQYYLISFWSGTRFAEIKDHISSLYHSCCPGNCLPLHLQLCNNTAMFSINLRLKLVSCRLIEFTVLCTNINQSRFLALIGLILPDHRTCTSVITSNRNLAPNVSSKSHNLLENG